MEEREELWLEGGGVRFVYTDDYVDSIRAKVAELEAKLEKYQKLEPVAWISAGGDVTRSRKLHEDMGFATYPLYALEK